VADRSPLQSTLDGIVKRLRKAEPELQAVILCGSLARGDADRFSDLDILAVTRGAPVRSERTWLETTSTGEVIHVSVGMEELDDFDEDESEPASWALSFPVVDTMQVLWATPLGRKTIGESASAILPGGPAEIEDFAELFMKVRRANAIGDHVMLRWAARMLAEYSVGLFRPYNPPVEVSTPVQALKAALAFSVAPQNYRTDFEVCAGLVEASDVKVFESAERLQEQALTWLRTRLEGRTFADDDVRALVLDGSLQSYLKS
jgi:predicted nucleotidyltransferase